jgi:RNA polymerase sigma factor (TIGR02999 family)
MMGPMSASASAQLPLTQWLQSWQQGNADAFAPVFEQAYAELRRIAAMRIAKVAGDATLTPTELLHEAVLRVLDGGVTWQNRAHFFASMSVYMRAVLVDHARARLSDKRGAGAVHVTLGGAEPGQESGIVDLLALDQALNQLEQLDARCSAVLHLTLFAGLPRNDIADVLKVSVQIVDRELRFAKSWLHHHAL